MSHVNVERSCRCGALMNGKCQARLHKPELLWHIFAEGYSLKPARQCRDVACEQGSILSAPGASLMLRTDLDYQPVRVPPFLNRGELVAE